MRIAKRMGLALALLASVPLAPPHATAQQLTVERLFGSRDFRPRSVALEWMADGQGFAVVEPDPSEPGNNIWVEGIRTGDRTRLVEGRTLIAADTSRPVEIEEYAWSPDRSKLLIFSNSERVWRLNTKGLYYVYDVATRRITPLSTRPGLQMFAKFSPDGRRVGFVRDNDLWVVDLATGQERQLTSDGSATIINGTSDWVYEEELEVRDAWRWSPDGERIAFWRFDTSPIQPFYMIDELGGQYSRPLPLPYPKAGTPNSRVRIGVLELAGGQTTWMDVGGDPDVYLARMEFAESPTEIVIQRLNRHQNQLDVLMGDVRTGRTRVLFSEKDAAWVDVDDAMTWINGGRQFLWTSERDGYNHLYLYNRDGSLVRQVTRGEWDFSELHGVDERGGVVYFSAANPTPLERQFFRVGLNGRGLRRISTEPGTHGINLNPNLHVYLDAYSRAGQPTVYRLHDISGRVIRVLEDNAEVAANVRQAAVPAPEFFQFTTTDGTTLNAWMLKPRDFDPSRKYPVLMYVYGGPGSQTVLDAWGGTRYLWHAMLAERGYLVVSVDNRGTGARGRDFKKLTYLNLGEWETRDQIEGARHLASLPYVDAERIGIWGWSYGGYMTLMTLMRDGGDLFDAGISVAPVTHWGLYDTIYTERFMRTPQENAEGYRQSAPLSHAALLNSDLLLIHGTGDDNVHFQNSTQMVAALQEAGKQFDFMLYPNQTHSISDTQAHLFRLMTDWILENL